MYEVRILFCFGYFDTSKPREGFTLDGSLNNYLKVPLKFRNNSFIHPFTVIIILVGTSARVYLILFHFDRISI